MARRSNPKSRRGAGLRPASAGSGKPEDRSGKTLEWASRVDYVPDPAERREICVLAHRAESGRQRELRIDSGADRIEARPAGWSPFAGRFLRFNVESQPLHSC